MQGSSIQTPSKLSLISLQSTKSPSDFSYTSSFGYRFVYLAYLFREPNLHFIDSLYLLSFASVSLSSTLSLISFFSY